MRTSKLLFIVVVFLTFQFQLHAQASLWVGQSYRCDATSSVMGLTTNVSWSTNGGYISLRGSGFYRDVTITQFFSGTASVTVTWQYKLYSNDTYKNQSKTWTFKCNDNPVTISPTSLTLAPGQTAELFYSLRYSNDYSYAAQPYFSSNNSSVASVTENGTVLAKQEGTAYINVYSKSSANSPYCIITVKEIAPTSVSIQNELTIIKGNTYTLKPSLYPSGASSSYMWESENPNVASVNSYGVVTGIETGKTRIKVTTIKGNLSAYCNVTVKDPPPPPSAIRLKKNVVLYKNFSTVLHPELDPNDAETSYSWSSNNTDVVTVSSSGRLTAKEIGTASVKVVTENGLSAETSVEVLEVPEYIEQNVLAERVNLISSMIKELLNLL